MNITIYYKGKIPTKYYGGTARDIWYLGKELKKLGNKITYLVDKDSFCPFADVIYIDNNKKINDQIPIDTDIINLHSEINEELNKPYLLTVHGNTYNPNKIFPINTNFVSLSHATRHGAEAFVYNGMDWSDYPQVDFSQNRNGYHFLAKAAWRLKNLKAAIKIARSNKKNLEVMGGNRINLSMGFRITLDPHIHFHGMVDDNYKAKIMNKSEALLFPVLWHEPMGLAIIESLYYGCPVIATPYGSLPEIVSEDYGFLSNRLSDLIYAAAHLEHYDRIHCHQYARDTFNSQKMAEKYLFYYNKILNGENINKQKPRLINSETKKFLDFYWD